jgi:DNA-binding response OmpR family regulator
MAHIVALVTDPELAAELEAGAKAAGHDIDVCVGEAEAWDACEEPTDLLIVDASSDAMDGVTLVDSMRAAGQLHAVRTVALHRHADDAAKIRAEEVSFDLDVPLGHGSQGSELVALLLGPLS